MKKIHRLLAPVTLALVLLTAACSPQTAGLTSAEATALANGGTGLPAAVTTMVTGVVGTGTALTVLPGTGTPLTPAGNETQAVPVTGGEPPVQLCQFCMDEVAHAIIAIPETSTFTASTAPDGTPAATCNSVETLNGRQVVICYSSNPSTFNLNVCASDGACTNFLVSLQACPNSHPAPKKANPTEPAPTSTLEPTQPAPTGTLPVPTGTPVPPTPTP